MLYAASSRRSSVILQRQASSRESKRNLLGNENNNIRPSSSSSSTRPARPNTANGFRAEKKPSTPYKSNSVERVQHSRDTFMLTDDDLQQFYRFMAKKGEFAPKTGSSAKPKRGHRENKPDISNVTTASERPWEDNTVASNITLSLSDFFSTFQLAHTPNGGFLDGIFDLVGTKDFHAMTYGEFLDGVCTFGMFKFEDMLKFVFFILDKDKQGRIPRFQLLRFVESIHVKKILVFEQVILPNDKKPPSRAKDDTLRLPAAERQKSSVDFLALKKLCIDYPTMLEPMLLFQDTLRRRIMGEVWWKRKENEIEKHFRTLDQSREKERRKEEKRLHKERKDKIIAEVGRIPYYLRAKSRIEAEKEYPKPIVSLEEETGKISVEWTRTDGKDDGSVHTG
ncbi:hypothetical protein ACHAXR_011086 [Thalassiosira sp. AJA248-18]